MLEECLIDFVFSGSVELNERGKEDKNGHWPKAHTLVETDHKTIGVTFFTADDGKAVKLTVHAAHCVNNETNRGYHSRMQMRIDYHDVQRLRDFLSLLLMLQDIRS
jgi:hypothetical protein